MSVIDIHPHILSPDRDTYPLDPVGGKVSGWASSRPVSAEGLLERMDAAGVAKAAVVQASTAYGYDNSYVIDSAARYPDRFVAVCCADPTAATSAELVKEWAAHPQVGGVRLFTTGSTVPDQADWLNDVATYPFWSAVAESNLPVCVQMRLGALPALTDILQRFPSVVVVLDHMAYPPVAPGREREAFEALASLAQYAHLYLKLTVRVIEPLLSCDASGFLDPLLSAFGSQRIAWGSNFPAAEQSLAELLDMARRALAGLSADDRDNVFSNTARTLYPALR